jgi:hypothetical protein
MDAPSRSWFASLQAAFVLLLLAPLLALPLAWLGYSRSHLERQGLDIVNHLVIAHQLTVQDGQTERVLSEHTRYPASSHRLIVWSSPLFGGDLLLAMRYMAAVTMLALLFLPYVLLCRLVRPLPALVLLLAWHLVCYYLKVDGVNHFVWEGQYNYSRAVGTVAFWLALIALSTRSNSPVGRLALQGLAIACGCFALACHIAPGAVTFGTVMAWQGACWLRERRREHLLGAGCTLLAAGGMLFATDVWVYMAQNASSDGWLPVGSHYLLLVWVPTLLAGLVLYVVRLRSPLESEGAPIEAVLMAGLLASGGLQAYLTYRMLTSGACAPYAVKSIYFFTFPLAALLLIRWAGQWTSQCLERVPPWIPGSLAIGLSVWLGGNIVRADMGLRHQVDYSKNHTRKRPTKDQLPDGVARQLKGSRGEFVGYYYYDPIQVFGSYYATVVSLDVERIAAIQVLDVLSRNANRMTPEVEAELARSGFKGVLLPEDADPARIVPGLGPVVKSGKFWKCPVPARVSVIPR